MHNVERYALQEFRCFTALMSSARAGASYSAASIFTSAVIFFQAAISPASQVLASSADFEGTMLKFCLVSASLAAGAASASAAALWSVSSTGLGVPAGANIALQAVVPTAGEAVSAMVGTSG